MFKKLIINSKRRIYLDYASVTPTDKRVISCVSTCLKKYSANASSLYKEGVEARKKIEEARKDVSIYMEVQPDEIYFTSGGTESNNLAIMGVIKAAFKNSFQEGDSEGSHKIPHIVTLSIEHPSIIELLKALEAQKRCDVTYVDVNENGIVDAREIKKALRPETVLVSVMYANNEIGTIQPISEIAKVIRAYKKEKRADSNSSSKLNASSLDEYPYFHTDACQAAVYESLRVPSLGIDLLTLDGSKIYGPRGTGILYTRRGVKISPVFFGGGQEKRAEVFMGRSFSLRPGTENVSGAVGFALALKLCAEYVTTKSEEKIKKESYNVKILRDWLLEQIVKNVPGIQINGDAEKRLPNNINICLPGIDAEFAVLKLDARGIAVSSVTSCRAQNEDSSSYVIEALENAKKLIASGDMSSKSYKDQSATDNVPLCSKSSLRITLGRYTTKREVKIAAKAIIEVLTAML